jgi:hypothetical protein
MPAAHTRKSMAFTVVQAAYVRAFAHGEQGSDIDFYLWVSSETEHPIHQSTGTQDVESAVWFLEPGQYTLQLAFYQVPQDTTCNYYHFEFDLRDRNTGINQSIERAIERERERESGVSECAIVSGMC